MLSSSDAKWRCMWHLLVWSVMLTLVSQLLDLRHHVAFYLFGAITVIILPVLTSIYCNTSGKHGKGLLRVGYVICDPVLGCASVTPLLLLRHLPAVVEEYYCFSRYAEWNVTVDCIANRSRVQDEPRYFKAQHPPVLHHQVLTEKRSQLLVMQCATVFPCLVVLTMWRRTHKMSVHTFLLAFVYWFVAGLEAATLLEASLLGEEYKHIIFTSTAIVSIAMIITNSYAVSTLCSYVIPLSSAHRAEVEDKFDFVYKVLCGTAGVFFAETPFLIARLRALVAGVDELLSGTFYIWLLKDVLFVGIIFGVIYTQKFGHRLFTRLRCRPSFDSHTVHFEPEKRDKFLHRKVGLAPIAEEDTEKGETALLSAELTAKPKVGSAKRVSFSLSSEERIPSSISSENKPAKEKKSKHLKTKTTSLQRERRSSYEAEWNNAPT